MNLASPTLRGRPTSELELVCTSTLVLSPDPAPGPHSLPDVSVPVGFPANHRSVCPCVLLYIHPKAAPAVLHAPPYPSRAASQGKEKQGGCT